MDAEATETPKILGEDTAPILNRLARVEGQVRGLRRMVEEGKDCEQILTQLAAARSALDGVGTNLISHHMRECLETEIPSEMDPAVMEKAFDTFLKYVRCMK